MDFQETISQLEIMARVVYGDDAWIGCNQVTGCTLWYDSRDVALANTTLDKIKTFLIEENQDNQTRFNNALKKLGA